MCVVLARRRKIDDTHFSLARKVHQRRNTFTLYMGVDVCRQRLYAANPQEDSSARLIKVYAWLPFNCNSWAPPRLPQVPIRVERVQKRDCFTLFTPSALPLRDLKVWTWHTLTPAVSVVIDSGAHRALASGESDRRVLANGTQVLSVRVAFVSGHAVRILVRKVTIA